jgi:hypothetical protein
LKALCSTCATIMHKAISLATLGLESEFRPHQPNDDFQQLWNGLAAPAGRNPQAHTVQTAAAVCFFLWAPGGRK